MEYKVSEDVMKAADLYASERWDRYYKKTNWNFCYDAFIAGAFYQKPIEHSQLPEQEIIRANDLPF